MFLLILCPFSSEERGVGGNEMGFNYLSICLSFFTYIFFQGLGSGKVVQPC